MLRSIQKCDEGSDMQNDLKMTLEYVDELGRLKLANVLAKVANIGPQAPVHSERSGGSRKGGRRGGVRAGYGRTTEPDPIYEEGDDLGAEESWLDIDWVLSDDDGRTPRCTFDAGVGPSHTASHEETISTQTTARGASMDYEDPHRMSLVFSGSVHDGGCIFVPTPGMPTPPLVHMEPTIPTSSPTPHEEAIQIEQIPSEDIEPVVGLRRSRRPPAHAPNYGTDDGMYFVYTSYLLELLILCI